MPRPLFIKLVVQGAIGLFCLLFGCIFAIQTQDKVFFILSLVIVIYCFVKTYLFYQLLKKKSYYSIEVTILECKPDIFRNTQQIIFFDKGKRKYRFSLNKNVKLLKGYTYRLYFRLESKHLLNSYNTTIALSQYFLGFEEIAFT